MTNDIKDLLKGTQIASGYALQSEQAIDARFSVPKYEDIQILIDAHAAYPGLIIYVQENTKTYQIHKNENEYSIKEFGLSDDAKTALKEEFLNYFLDQEFTIDANEIKSSNE